jgi:predicted NAD/FAD-dependent oxidoreductase
MKPITDAEIVSDFRAETRVWQRWMAEGRDDDNACSDIDAALADAISDEEMAAMVPELAAWPEPRDEPWPSESERDDEALYWLATDDSRDSDGELREQVA